MKAKITFLTCLLISQIYGQINFNYNSNSLEMSDYRFLYWDDYDNEEDQPKKDKETFSDSLEDGE